MSLDMRISSAGFDLTEYKQKSLCAKVDWYISFCFISLKLFKCHHCSLADIVTVVSIFKGYLIHCRIGLFKCLGKCSAGCGHANNTSAVGVELAVLILGDCMIN